MEHIGGVESFSLTKLHSFYQMPLKVEEKLKKRHEYSNKGRRRGRDYRSGSSGRGNENRGQGDSKLGEQTHESNNRGDYGRGKVFYSGGRGISGGFGRISHFSSMKCYNCGQLGHLAYRFLDKPSSSQGENKITYVQEEDYKHSEVILDLEKGENMMLKKSVDKKTC